VALPEGGIVPYLTIVAGSTITSSWANANVRDQVVTPFANAAARTSAVTSPIEGMQSYLQDVNRNDFYNGSAWQPAAGVAAKVVRSGNQIIPSGVITNMEWQTVVYDAHGMWNGANPTRLTAPWTGFYAPSTSISWESSNSGAVRRTGLYVNGVVEDQSSTQLNSAADGQPLRQNCSSPGVFLMAGQYVEVKLTHDAGGDRTIDTSTTNFKLAYLGPAA
jgi:hypothetical protein